MKGLALAALGFAAAANALAILSRPEWVFPGLLISVVMPFAGAMVALFGTSKRGA